ncbi:MAG: phosphatidate cytidylyltransferase [Planctomycetota bacterium]
MALTALIFLASWRELVPLLRGAWPGMDRPARHLTALVSAGLVFAAMGAHLSPALTVADTFPGETLALFLLGTKCQDIFAYFTGYFIGSHKMAPTISPKKTWEGAFGGVAGAALGTWMFAGLWATPCPLHPGIYGALLGISSLGGDLLESKLKRMAGVKDSGALVPGFGGVLDMVDSLILAAPLSLALHLNFPATLP